jgi:multisubunit Na+/H+ antiporter MnhE subunit
MRRVVSLVVWWALLVCLWALYVGTSARIEILWGLGAAVVGAVAAEVVRSQGLFRFRVDPRWILRAWKTLPQIVFDFGLIVWELVRALAHGRRVSGAYVAVPFPAGNPALGVDRWRRAFSATVGTMTPNGIVVDIDPDTDLALMHSIRPDVSTGHQVL